MSRMKSNSKDYYLLFYSLVSFFMWSLVFYHVVTSFFTVTPFEFYQSKKYYIMAAQLICSMEAVHALLKITNAPFLPGFFMNSGKCLVLFFCINRSPVSQERYTVMIPPLVWSIGESTRGIFYSVKILEDLSKIEFPTLMKILVLLRYNLFVVLLWVGLFTELHQCYLFLPKYKEIAAHPACYYALVTYLILGPLALFPVIYMRLLNQRKKVKKNGWVLKEKKKE